MTIHSSTLLAVCFLVTGVSTGFAAGSAPMSAPTPPPNISEKAREVQKKSAPDARALSSEGFALMKARKYREAQAKFEAALQANPRLAGPELAKVHNNLAFVLRKQSRANFGSALEHYNEAIRLNPKLAEAYEYRGVLYAEMNRKADAEKDLATLKHLNPKLAADLEMAIKTGKEKEY